MKSPSFNIKIALLGHVSVGKTTLLNALLGDKFSEVSKKRTTAGVNHFRVVSSIQKGPQRTCDNSNSDDMGCDYDDNDEISTAQDQSDGEKKFFTPTDTLNQIIADNLRLRADIQIEEKTFDVLIDDPIIPSCIPNADVQIVFSDFPGINEAKTKLMYTDFVRKTWDTFDCAIVVMDASQGVNTEEQIKLLKFVKQCNGSYKEIPLIIVCNKVDDETDEEMMALVDEARKEVEKLFKVGDRNRTVDRLNCDKEGCVDKSPAFLHMSAENAFVYRCASKVAREDLHKLGKSYIDKIGHEEVGKIKWNGMSLEEKHDTVYKVVSDPILYKSRLELSNVDKLLKVLESFVGGECNQKSMIGKQIEVRLKKVNSDGDFASVISGLYPLLMIVGQPVECLFKRYWCLYDECKKEALAKLMSDPNQVHCIGRPMQQLITFKSFLQLNGLWQLNIDLVRLAIIELVNEQIKLVKDKFNEFGVHCLKKHIKDCCDPWSYYRNSEWRNIDGSTRDGKEKEHPEMNQYKSHWKYDEQKKLWVSIYNNETLSHAQMLEPYYCDPWRWTYHSGQFEWKHNDGTWKKGEEKTHPEMNKYRSHWKYDPKDKLWHSIYNNVTASDDQLRHFLIKPTNNGPPTWSTMTRRDWSTICGSILLMRYSKMFCKTFGAEILALEEIIQRSGSTVNCTCQNVIVESSFSSSNHWGNIAWSFCELDY